MLAYHKQRSWTEGANFATPRCTWPAWTSREPSCCVPGTVVGSPYTAW